jgi:hypothetical protein
MTRHQRTISILLFVALLAAVIPSAALANSLLSGYGGPGAGNQAILGSALLNAPKGGGGGGAGGSGASGGGQVSSSRPTESASSQTGDSTGASKSASGKRSKRRTASTKRRDRGATTRTSRGAVIYPAASSEVTTGGSRTVGLSGADFAYIILALGVLALTGFLTMRLTRTTVAREPDGRL